MAAEDKYQWSGLPDSKSFRILELLAGDDSHQLQGRLHIQLTPTKLDYEAISYAWGDPTPCGDTIALITSITGELLDELRTLSLAANVNAALRRFRLKDQSRFLWVDAICIDQDNLDERAQQVRMMRQIFQNARRVLIFVGEEAEDSARVPAAFAQISHAFQKYQQKHPDPKSHQPILSRTEREQFGFPSTGSSDLMLLSTFLRRSWFQRSWVLQEAVVAREAVLVYGEWECPIDDFCNPILLCLNLNLFPHSLATYQGLQGLADLRGTAQMRKIDSFLSLLCASRARKATDPKDSIFAYVGLSTDSTFSSMVDYHKSTAEVFQEFAKLFIDRGQGARLLRECCRDISDPEEEKIWLPSWVPDWSLGNYKNGQKWTGRLNASQRASAVMKVSENGRELHIRGFILDQVKLRLTDDRVFPRTRDLDYWTPLQFWFHNLERLFDPVMRERLSKEAINCLKWALLDDRNYAKDHAKFLGVSLDCFSLFFETLLGFLLALKDDARVTKKLSDVAVVKESAFTETSPGIGSLTFHELRLAYESSQHHALGGVQQTSWGNFEFATADDLVNLNTMIKDRENEPYLVRNLYEHCRSLMDQMIWTIGSYSFGTTDTGYVCQMPIPTAQGDLIAVLKGLDDPYVLRPVARDGVTMYQIIGVADIPGIMSGEIWTHEHADLEDIIII